MSGQWCAFVFFLTLGYSGQLSAEPLNAKRARPSPAQLAAEQQRAFELSSGSRVMPSAVWFVAKEYDKPSPIDPMETRWLSQIDLKSQQK